MRVEITSARYSPPEHYLTLSSTDIKRLQKHKEVTYVCGDGTKFVLKRKQTKLSKLERENESE